LEAVKISKVSIITVCYNASDVISKCLDSVEKQVTGNFSVEHIVIDGGSKDGTVDIVNGHSSPDHFISEQDNGLYDAMNKGIALSTGDVVAFLNSDDEYSDPKVLVDIVSEFRSSNSKAVFGDLVVLDAIDHDKIIRKWNAGPKGNFKHGWMPPHPSLFVRKSVFNYSGNFNIDFKFSADYEWMIRALHSKNLSLSYLPRTIVKMRAGGLSNASLINRLKAHIEDYKAWKVNRLIPYPWTILLKPLRKVTQFIK